MWGPDVPVVPPQIALRWFSIAVLGFVSLGVLCNYAHPVIPAIRREYPFDGLSSELGGLEENKVSSRAPRFPLRASVLTLCCRRGWRGTLRTRSRFVPYAPMPECAILPANGRNWTASVRSERS